MKNTVIDIGKLSPATQDSVKVELNRVLFRNINEIEGDIVNYLDGVVRDEMQGWLNAAKDLMKQVNEK
jgi:hypothetical protein